MTKKRIRDDGDDRKEDVYKKAYTNFSYQAVPSSDRPGSPHRYFASSYTVQESGTSTQLAKMRVHRHANGLCIVTAGDLISVGSIEHMQFHPEEAPASSAGTKRKQQSKLLRGKDDSSPGVVRPGDVLCTIQMKDQSKVEIPCSVWGTVVELNPYLKEGDCSRLVRDPLFSGYLAVILPTGPFPPPQDEADV